jgi:flagellar hook-length control protein FliK
MPTNIPLFAAPAGEPALPAVVDSNAGVAAAVPTGERTHPAPVTDPGLRAELAHNIAAPLQASVDHVQSRANLPDAADSGAPTMLGAAAASAGDAWSTGRSRPPQVDPKLVDGALAAAPQITSGAALAADFRLVSQGGDGAAPDNSALAVIVAGTGTANPAPAAPAPENSSNLSAANPTPGDISDQLFGHLLRYIQNPEHDVVLRLNPPELGDLTVRVVVSGREVSAWFATPQAQVQQAISQAIGQLHTSLGNAGYDLAGAWVGADASNPRERDSPLPSAQPGDAPARAEPIIAPEASPGTKAGSGVSIYV